MAVLRLAVADEVEGTFNVAGDGVIMLSQAARRIGRTQVPLPSFAVGAFGGVLKRAGLADFSPEQVAFLTYGRGVDTTRMRTELGFTPTYSTPSAFGDFAASLPEGIHSPGRIASADGVLAGLSQQLTRGGTRG